MQGGVNGFSAEEATLIIGELYIMRRREGDEFESLLKQLQQAGDTINEFHAERVELQNQIEELQNQVEEKCRIIAQLHKRLNRGKR